MDASPHQSCERRIAQRRWDQLFESVQAIIDPVRITNQAPVINAATDQTIALPSSVLAEGKCGRGLTYST
jgi:hypothetical protein